MNTIICPLCGEGELQVRIHYEPRTFHYPGHKETEIISQSCKCDLEREGDALWEEATV